tara:strand:+ start:88 stop:288 length:201 start_codon:yes stop_codon:yes gene_type:complete
MRDLKSYLIDGCVIVSLLCIIGLMLYSSYVGSETQDKELAEECTKYENKSLEQCEYEIKRDKVGTY